MKILHVIETYLPVIAGYTIRTKYIVENQRRIGLDPMVIISALGVKSRVCECINGVKYIWASRGISYSTSAIRMPLQWFNIDKILKRDLCVICEEYQPDIVHAHSFPPLRKSVSQVCRRLNIPYVFELRSILEEGGVASGNFKRGSLRYRLIRHYSDYNLNNSDSVVVISEALKSEIVKRGVSKSRITVVPNAVDTKSFLPHDSKDSQVTDMYDLNGCFILGYIGTFSGYEGLEFLIQAMPKILLEVKNAKLVLVGYGNSLQCLKELTSELKIEHSVVFTGRIPFEEIRRYYSIFDVMLLPRKNATICNIVSPLKPLEIMSQAIPLIVSELDVMKEIIHSGKTGILVEPENPEEIARSVIMLAKDREYAMSLGENARKWIVENRDWNTVIKRYFSIYEGLLSDDLD